MESSSSSMAATSAAAAKSEEPPPSKRTRLADEEDSSPSLLSDDADKQKGVAEDIENGGKSDESILDPISSKVLSNPEALSESYKTAKPYPHGVIEGLCVDGFLEQVLDEVKQNSKVKFKESDLFRVYQSIDLGNLDDESPLARQMPHLMKLKHALYSPEYRGFIENIAGLSPGTLTGQVDCAANCHAKGCHLLCHDDVIGTRKISYILYLTDPEPQWLDEDGGRLELYDSLVEERTAAGGSPGEEGGDEDDVKKVPGAFPVKTVLPAFNSMAYFEVNPGVSFHSVQEVFCDRPRLSIQGWYHAKEGPSNIQNATLSRLKSTAKGEDTEGSFFPFHGTCDEAIVKVEVENGGGLVLTEADRKHLEQYINTTYLTDASLTEIRKRFEEDSSVQLRHFFNEEWAKKIGLATLKEDERDAVGKDRPALDYTAGVRDDWKPVGPAHKQRFLEYTGGDNTSTAGSLLMQVKRKLFESPEFARWLKCLTSLGVPLGHRGRVRRFRPGLDYTVAHYGVLTTKAVLDATLCFAAGKGNQCSFDEETGDLVGTDADATWESGDAGGFECYIAADEDEERKEADDEYDEEDDTELLSVSASNNTLSLVYRDPGTMRFVKYVGSSAPSSRWDVSLEYEVADDNYEKEGSDACVKKD